MTFPHCVTLKLPQMAKNTQKDQTKMDKNGQNCKIGQNDQKGKKTSHNLLVPLQPRSVAF